MTLAARLLLAFGFVAVFATAAVGLSLRDAARRAMEEEFDARAAAAAKGMRLELGHEGAALKGLLDPLCDHDTIVDKALAELERVRGDVRAFDTDRRIAIRHLVPAQAQAFQVDELFLVTGDGTILGAAEADVARLGTKDDRLATAVRSPPGPPVLRTSHGAATAPQAAGKPPSMEVHCSRSSSGVTIGLVGARRIDSILRRVGEAYGVGLQIAPATKLPPPAGDVSLSVIEVPEVVGLSVLATVPRAPLVAALRRLDQNLLYAGAAALAIALLSAALLARSLSRPIVALAHETREVVAGQPRPVRAQGGRELVQLAESFNRTIEELASMRRRLALTERIAAQREVARQIAHEIKNPLAPIRAAVETLRRLRARDDPAFDEYFDEATLTVLDEVVRIANIVTEFTKFARLPPPSPEPIDLAAVAKGVVTLHSASVEQTGRGKKPKVELVVEGELPKVSADRDQIVQVLTNLVQNGLDAAAAVRDDPRVIITMSPHDDAHVRIVVRDNGPGVPEEWIPKLFVPYQTTKKDKGTGLGLAIVQRIVLEHGGEIAYRTATKGGAVFEIVLPVAGPPALAKPALADVTQRG